MTTNQKGAVAEAKIAAAALDLGLEVYRPVFEGGRYDLILGLETTLLRVQCKWANRRGDVVVVRAYSARRTRTGMLNRCYTAAEIDAVAAYCKELDRCYLLPVGLVQGRGVVHLHLGPCRNNQTAGVNCAERYSLTRGAIAQLGERRAGSAKVAGSSPASSTS